jgi:hypothetical protein
MGLFSYFNRKNGYGNGLDVLNPSTAQLLPEIPENVFLAKENPQLDKPDEKNGSQVTDQGINLLFRFLDGNYEARGYDDALINPDNTHLEQNIKALKNDLERTIKKIKTFYEDFIREINFHIGTRTRSGMVDTVEELTMKKETAENHIKQVIEIEEQANNNQGVGQGIILSYTRGFRNGLAAISHHLILRKNF